MSIFKDTNFDVTRILKSVDDIGLHLGITNSGKFIVNNFVIPGDYSEWVFENFGKLRIEEFLEPEFGSPITFDLTIKNDTYSYTQKSKGFGVKSKEFFKNGRLHSLFGPAKKSKHLNLYMKDGELHRANGPAIERVSGFGRKVYALNGKILDFTSYIESNPKAIQGTLYHNGNRIRSSTYGNYKVIKIGNHKWLLKKKKVESSNHNQVKQALLSSMYKFFPLYSIVKYKAPNIRFKELNQTLGDLCSADDIYVVEDKKSQITYLSGSLMEGYKTSLNMDLGKNEVRYSLTDSMGQDVLNFTERLDGIVEAGDTMSKINIGHMDDLEIENIVEELFNETTQKDVTLNGINVPSDIAGIAHYNPESKEYSWKDANGYYHSPRESCPGVIHSDGTLEYWKHGYLHKDNGAAVLNLYNRDKNEYWINGIKVTFDEHIHYTAKDNKVVFKKDGKLHRTDGPAVMDFKGVQLGNPPKTEYWTDGAEIIMKTPEVYTLDLSSATSIKLSDDWASTTAWTIYPEEKNKFSMAEEHIMAEEKIIRGGPDVSGGRLSQVWEGGKHGFKQGVVNASSKMVADKIVEAVDLDVDSENASKIVQLILLMLSAEVINNVPESVAEKIKLDYETQQELVTFFHLTSGENIGRELVGLASSVLPYVKDLISDFTTEEILDFAEQYEQKEPVALESKVHKVTLEELIEQMESAEAETEEVQEVEVAEVEYVGVK